MNQSFRLKKVKYQRSISMDHVLHELKEKKDSYLTQNNLSKSGRHRLWFKAIFFIFTAASGYFLLMNSESFLLILSGYLLTGSSLLFLGINLGHDAAHHCLTGNKKTDDLIFEIIFGLQGMNGYLWKIRHNHSHHPFPNVHAHDSDLGITNLILLNPSQRRRKIYQYQHIYAPFLYMFFSLIWIFYIDFHLFFQTTIANVHSLKHPGLEWIKLILYKIISLTFFLIIPLFLADCSTLFILAAFLVMHMILSLFLTLVFFISHHVEEIAYTEPSDGIIAVSWLEQQVSATSDFHAQSKLANFFFGGFNAHLAHHLFPDVSHVHYPALTKLIVSTLNEHGIKYHSLNFFKAVRSHLALLKSLPQSFSTAHES